MLCGSGGGGSFFFGFVCVVMLVMCKVYQTMGVNRCHRVLSGSPVHSKKANQKSKPKKGGGKKDLEKINFRQFGI